MACGTTTVCSDCTSGPREILSPASDFRIQLKDKIEYGEYGVLYPVGAIDLLVESTVKMLNDPALRNQYIEAGQNRIGTYRKEKIADEYLAYIA